MENVKQEIIDKVESSLNYYNVDADDLNELLKDCDESDMNEILEGISTLNTLLFKCEI
jgi:hypothetical protein